MTYWARYHRNWEKFAEIGVIGIGVLWVISFVCSLVMAVMVGIATGTDSDWYWVFATLAGIVVGILFGVVSVIASILSLVVFAIAVSIVAAIVNLVVAGVQSDPSAANNVQVAIPQGTRSPSGAQQFTSLNDLRDAVRRGDIKVDR